MVTVFRKFVEVTFWAPYVHLSLWICLSWDLGSEQVRHLFDLIVHQAVISRLRFGITTTSPASSADKATLPLQQQYI